MEEKTLEYYHLKIEQLLTSNESLNQEKSDLQDEAEALQDRIDELEEDLETILKDIESGHFVAHDTVELIKKALRKEVKE